MTARFAVGLKIGAALLCCFALMLLFCSPTAAYVFRLPD